MRARRARAGASAPAGTDTASGYGLGSALAVEGAPVSIAVTEGVRGARTTNPGGRPRAERTNSIRAAILELPERHERMTVRGVFYALASRGIVPKDDTTGYRPVQRQVLALRREGLVRWGFIADGTRWVRRADTFDGVEDALEQTARLYRRDLWASQNMRVELWLEKDALADLIWPAVDRWGVPLYVSRGVPSETYVHSAAMDAREDGRMTTLLCLYDHDAGGARAFRKVERGFAEFAPGCACVQRLGLTLEQVREWRLPTRPAKRTDPQAATWGDLPAVELDAAPPERLTHLVDEAIVDLVDHRAWQVTQATEREERAGLLALHENLRAAA